MLRVKAWNMLRVKEVEQHKQEELARAARGDEALDGFLCFSGAAAGQHYFLPTLGVDGVLGRSASWRVGAKTFTNPKFQMSFALATRVSAVRAWVVQGAQRPRALHILREPLALQRF